MRFEALTVTAADVAVTVRSAAIRASLVVSIQFQAMAAAMPVPPPLSPDWPLELLLAEVVWSLDFGVDLPLVCPLVFGLSLTCWSDLVSELLSLSPLPRALAVALALSDISEVVVTVTEVALTDRSRAARELQSRTTFSATMAPMATSPLAASADPVVSISLLCSTPRVSVPVTVSAEPLPSLAVTCSWLLSSSPTAGVIAGLSPLVLVPASTSVTIWRRPAASMSTLWPPLSATPFSTSDRTVFAAASLKMLRATAAPTPTASPTSALPDALERSRSLLRLLSVRSPVMLSVTEAPVATTASVRFFTMLSERAPATPTDVESPAPASASASISCSSSRKTWSALGGAGSSTP